MTLKVAYGINGGLLTSISAPNRITLVYAAISATFLTVTSKYNLAEIYIEKITMDIKAFASEVS